MADAGHRGAARRALEALRAEARLPRTAEPSTSRRRRAKSGNSSAQQLIFVCRSTPRAACTGTFRLEWQGTLRSWAVPKGPRSIPPTSASAVEVEDHPIAYAKFAGDIPKGQYGGGHVDIWDNGTWEPVGRLPKRARQGSPRIPAPRQEAHGKWHLVRTRMQGKQTQWLLMKSHDDAARAGADADVIDAGTADDRTRIRRGAPPRPAQSKPPTRPEPRSDKVRARAATRCPPPSSRSSPRWSIGVPATKAGCMSSSTTACACCAAAMAMMSAASRAMASTGPTRPARW
jgi:bifunctional non-homologous end joining protein LigD